MKEFYRPIKEEINRKKELSKESKKIHIGGKEDNLEVQKPMALKDNWSSLRLLIQEKTGESEESKVEDQKEIKLMSELITPKLMSEYRQILANINEKTEKSEGHPQREFVDLNSEECSEKIENWVEGLVHEVRNKKGSSFSENDIEEIRQQSWLLFDSIGNVMNTKSLEKDIIEFYKDNKVSNDADEEQKQRNNLVDQLRNRYPLEQLEIESLIKIIKSEGNDWDYTVEIFIETIERLWSEYKIGEKKGQISKISFGYLISKAVESFAPSLFKNVISNDNFNVMVAFESSGLTALSIGLNAVTGVELENMMEDVSKKINERMSKLFIFQEFEFIDQKSIGDIFSALEKGKNSTKALIKETISQFTPLLVGIVMSLGFLSSINPILGVAGVAGLPLMYKFAKDRNKQGRAMIDKENKEGSKVSTQVSSIKNGFEEIKTSPEMPTVATFFKELMDTKDQVSSARSKEEVLLIFKSRLSFLLSNLTSAIVGGILQSQGTISGGAVVSSIMYSNYLDTPVRNLIDLHYNKLSNHVKNIQHMEEIFGKYENLDLPEGEEEKGRLLVSKLENYDISIKNLNYKHILKDVNLDIKQGEMVTIIAKSGSGKSTLLRNLAGLYKADEGNIEIGGVDNGNIKKYGEDSLYSLMSYCTQNPLIFDGMTLKENLLLWSKKEIDDAEIEKILLDLNLGKFIKDLNKNIKKPSGGEKVRLGLARALIKGSKVMLLDEPTNALDSETADGVMSMLDRIKEQYPDTTIIYTTNDDRLVARNREKGGRVVDMANL